MLRLLDGPAVQFARRSHRFPAFVRAAVHIGTHRVRTAIYPGEEPMYWEWLYTYRLVRVIAGPEPEAFYRLATVQPSQDVMWSAPKWETWCLTQQPPTL